MKPVRGDLAMCSRGALGLVTENKTQRVRYGNQCDYCRGAISGADIDDGCTCETAMAYVGIHLTDKIAAIGSPWCSRKPIVIGKLRIAAILGYGNIPSAVFEAAAKAHREIIEWMEAAVKECQASRSGFCRQAVQHYLDYLDSEVSK